MKRKNETLYHTLAERLEAVSLSDTAALHSLRNNCGFYPKNVRELLQSDDKTQNLYLLGCDEKYKNGTASDYETFAEWERIMPLCVGTGSAALYAEEKRLLGIDAAPTPREAWHMALTQPLTQKDSFVLDTVSDQTIDITDELSNLVIKKEEKPISYADLLAFFAEAIKERKARENKGLRLILDCNFDSFEAPNRYRAEQIVTEKICVENYNKNEFFLLSAQLFIDLILAAKRESLSLILHFRAWRTIERLSEFLDYLTAHRLLAGEIRIGISLDTDPRPLTELCRSLSGAVAPHPELILSPADFGTDIAERLRAFASVYPLAGLRFGGVNTDSPLFVAGHRLFKQALARLLSELCETEEQAMYLARSICEF